jgi:NTP pyrophosphatase (non-canonical NTP hydrolase)
MIRDFVAYQRRTANTAIYPSADTPLSYDGLSYCALGLTGEAGEVADKVKKIARDNGGVITAERRGQIAGELGDVLWYVAQLATQLGFDLDAIAQANLDKLADRRERGVLQGSGDNR